MEIAGLRWVRIIVAGLAAEAALFVISALVFMSGADPAAVLPVITPPACFLVFIPAGWWAARGAASKLVGHGLMTGVVGVALFLGIVAGAMLSGNGESADMEMSFSTAYLAGHALKLAGGVLGALIVARKRGGAIGA
jgi:hypothetical protein